ncbi:MAG TPA: ABC transporter substrate-binding protein [Steroidobacteraceae bacterium]|jgi:putative spermidine/putrescine transport system substrate-binding protein|nr:ABC transporter substrate-binding protein [Steroidobacteraceae bacterium]
MFSKTLLLVSCSAALTLAACAKKEEAPKEAAAAMPSQALEGALDIVAWPGYVERGQSDKAYDWVSKFEADTGCKVTVKLANTSDEMVSLMASGSPPPSPPGDASWPPAGNAPYDLVTASGDASLRLIRGGTVQPIGIERIPSYSSIDPRLQEAPWHYVDGKHWGVPYQWGPNVLLYNTKVFKKPPTSWSVVFEQQKLPDGKSNKGRVQAYDGPIYIADAALYLASKKPELGIKDPYELNEAAYGEVLKVLRAQHPLIQRYWHVADVQVADFTNEGIVASGSWPYQANTLAANKQPTATTVPAEGATGWADTTMLAAGARHPNCAYKWLEWSISPKVQGDVASFFGSVPVVPKACEGNELLGAEGCKTNGVDNFDKIKFWRTPEAKCASHVEGCVPYSRWVTDYVAIIGGQ